MNYTVGDKFENKAINKIYTITNIHPVSISLRVSDNGCMMLPVGDFEWQIKTNRLVPLVSTFTSNIKPTCSHTWKEERYFSARVFINCSKCGIAKP